MDREFVKYKFPNISEFEIYQNTESTIYNCISYSIGRKDVWSWSKKADPNNYWPIESMEETKEAFDEFYLYHGFKQIRIDIRYNGKTKIALYAIGNEPKHASIQIGWILVGK